MDDAAQVIRDRLPVVGERRYDHTDDGKYVDVETGEVLDSIPRR